MKGGGFVVTSGDTRLSPVIAFSDSGDFDGDESSPLHALLCRNLVGAVTALEREDGGVSKSAKQVLSSGQATRTASEAEWETLLSEPKSYASGKTSVSEPRVGAMLKTAWGQEGGRLNNGWGDYLPAFDYYIYKPNVSFSGERGTLPCGCVATAGAQLMYFWRYPTASMSQFTSTCALDGKMFTAKSIEGKFDWDKMFLSWKYGVDPTPTLAQRKAVGKLAWNLCVALETSWSTDGKYGGAWPSYLAPKLKNRFGYKSAKYIMYNLDMTDKPRDYAARKADFDNALYASLDANMPVYLALDGTSGGHTIVADGYGYVSSKRYVHMNFGWWGTGNAWYYMDDKKAKPNNTGLAFECFLGMGFNIHPKTAGDVISGRVLDVNGVVVPGVSVKLYDASGKLKKTVTTSSKGIYAFRITVAGTYKVAVSHSAAKETPSTTVKVAALTREGNWGNGNVGTGNKWGVDVSFKKWSVPDIKKLTLKSNSTSRGTVSGGGLYDVGAKVTIKAKRKGTNVFAGWFTDKACKAKLNPKGYDNRNATVKIVMPGANVTSYAKFVSKSSDKKSLKFSSSTKKLATTPAKAVAGESFSLQLGISSASLPTVTATGLPKGLSIDKATGKITGTPTKPGSYTATVTVKSAAGNKITQKVKFTVSVPSWAKGSFYGRAFPDGAGNPPAYLQFTVGSAGDVSGKVTYNGEDCSFTSAYTYCAGAKATFNPLVAIGSGTFDPGAVTVCARNFTLSGSVVECADAAGVFVAQKPLGLVKRGGALADLVGWSFTIAKDEDPTGSAGSAGADDKLDVLVVDGDAVTVSGVVDGKPLDALSFPLRVEDFRKVDDVDVYDLRFDVFDSELKYYKTIGIMAMLGCRPGAVDDYGFIAATCYAPADE